MIAIQIALGIIIVPVFIWLFAWSVILLIGFIGWSLDKFCMVIDWPERFIRRKMKLPQNPMSWTPDPWTKNRINKSIDDYSHDFEE